MLAIAILPGSGFVGLHRAAAGVFHRRGKDHRIVAFFQEIHRAVLHRVHGSRDVAVAGQKNHRQSASHLHEALLKLKSRHLGHADVKHKASWAV